MAKVWFADREKMLSILRLYMGIGMKRRRKDFAYARQIMELIGFFFNEDGSEREPFKADASEVKVILKDYLDSYSHDHDNSMWFDNLKAIADRHGYASDMKAYKAAPDNYKGSISDVAEMVRIAVTGKANTPDLWSIIHIIGEEDMRRKINNVIA